MNERKSDEAEGPPQRSPVPTRDQEFPAPERPLNAQEEAGQSIQELEDPPQAEGDRESGEA